MRDIPAEIREILDDSPGMELNVLSVIEGGGNQFYAIEQSNEEIGEVVVVRHRAGTEPSFVESASELPHELTADTDSGFSIRRYLNWNAADATPEDGEVPLDLTAAASLNPRVSRAAENGVGDPYMNSNNASGTNGGRLACAWAVNRLIKRELKSPIGGGLGTATMFPVLRSRHIGVFEHSAGPGAIIISPSIYVRKKKITGHVGILGDGNKIYSNSSRRARWEQNFTKDSWSAFFTEKKLGVYYFYLNKQYFPEAMV